MDYELKSRRQEILAIAARHGARNLRVFGSVARGEGGPESDLDILVEMEPGRSLMDHVALMQDLEDLLQRKVDLVSDRALHWYIRDRVLAEATLYDVFESTSPQYPQTAGQPLLSCCQKFLSAQRALHKIN